MALLFEKWDKGGGSAEKVERGAEGAPEKCNKRRASNVRAMTKRILSLALTLAMVLSLCLTVQAKGSVTVTLDGRALELTAPAYVDGNGRTQVPVTIGPPAGADLPAEGG